MKNIIILTAFLLLSITTITAQSQFGIKGGLNFSTLAVNKDQIGDSKTKPGFLIGVTNTNQIGLLFLQAELLYNRKGAEYQLVSNEVDADFDYLQVPVSVGISLFGSPINVYGGGYAAYLLNANYDYKVGDDVVATFDNKEAFRSIDIGVQAGVNLNLRNLVFDFRLARGLTDVEDDDILTSLQTYTKNETKNFNMEMTVAFQF